MPDTNLVEQENDVKQVLKPLINKTHSRKIWGFDIETHGYKNDFVMGSIVGDDNINKVFWDKHEMAEYFFKKRDLFRLGYVCALNLNFDATALFYNTKYFKDISPIIRNSQMLSVRLGYNDRQHLTFIDVWNFYKFSVEKWGNMLGIPKLEKPSCLGKIPRNEFERQELETYNLRDSYIVYETMKFLQGGFNTLGCNMKITISSTAMDLFRRKFLKKTIYQPQRHILDYLYKGYYGGRTEVIKRGRIKNLNYYDVNSLYPSVMIREYPDPERITFSHIIKKKTIMEYDGVAHVKVKTPEMYIPYLPYRFTDKKKQQKLLFPCGEFDGYYTFHELRKALELGYDITKYYDGVIYFKKFKPFEKYVNTLYDLRKEYKLKGDDMELIVKIMLNSLYGKFGQKIESKETIIHVDKMTEELVRKYKKIDRKGDFFIINKPYDKIPSFVNPIFSIYTTSYARDVLYGFMKKSKDKNVFYYDTDSLFTSVDIDTSLDLGEMKKEFSIKSGILVKPKMYLIDEKVKCKGVFKLNKSGFMDLLNTKSVNMRRFTKFKESNARGLAYNQIIDYTKTLDLEDNKRTWQERFNPDVLQDSKAQVI